jgi:predicted dehydrogenase
VEIEDNGQFLLDFGGAFATVTSSLVLQQCREPTLELEGSEGTIRLYGGGWAPDGYEHWQAGASQWVRAPETTPGWS